MNASHYRFRSFWTVPVHAHTVFDVLADIGSYPRWWPQVRSVEQIDEHTASLICRSLLPYRLHLRVIRRREHRDEGLLEVRLTGDLDGWSRWTLTPNGAGTGLLYEQEVVAHGRLLRHLGRVARPGLRFNHAWMMRSCRHGLARYLRAGRAAG
ncbi:MAG: SRPBCC family protein [Nocardioidaceae bacterium]